MKLAVLILLIPKQWFQVEEGDSDISKLPFSSFPLLEGKSWHRYLFLGLKTPFSGMVSELSSSDLWQNSDAEADVNVSPLIKVFSNVTRISSSYITRRMLIVLKISFKQAQIQNKGRKTRKDFLTK